LDGTGRGARAGPAISPEVPPDQPLIDPPIVR
jgi:hypothetical protein